MVYVAILYSMLLTACLDFMRLQEYTLWGNQPFTQKNKFI